jgi:hypothetical protein
VTRNEVFFMDNRFFKNNILRTYVRNSVDWIPPQFLKIYHQNIRGLRRKTNKISCCTQSDLPHFLYFSGHHLNQSELDLIHVDNYILGAKYCRQKIQRGSASIFVQNNLQFTIICLDSYCVG